MKTLLFVLVAFSIAACEPDGTLKAEIGDDAQPADFREGTYSGIFTRVSPAALHPPSEVTLTFNKTSYTGSSTRAKYPAICEGTFKIKGNTIEFENGCMWTADFDWTLILKGRYDLAVRNDSIFITRKYDGGTSDNFRLARK